jgi:hypothetical protein
VDEVTGLDQAEIQA